VDDVAGGLPLLLQDGTQAPARRYVYGVGLAYSVALGDSNDIEVYHTDSRGSVRGVTHGAAQIKWILRYDPFGTTVTHGVAGTPRFGLGGHQTEADAGLVYMRARYYDPALGRFLSRDTVMGDVKSPVSLNRFTYVLDNPLSFWDPSGKYPLWADDGGWWLLASTMAASAISQAPRGIINLAGSWAPHNANTGTGLAHAFYRHVYNDWIPKPPSTWTVTDVQVATLVCNAEHALQPWTQTNNGNWARLVQVEMSIGRSFGQVVDHYTVIVDDLARMNLVSTFPGRIREFGAMLPEFVPVLNRFPWQ
jgi:RHS repeat-associated protein